MTQRSKAYYEAVPLIAEGNQYLYSKDSEKETDTREFLYLLGAFGYNGQIIPVQFGLKHDKDNSSRIYITATIKEDAIMGAPQNNLKVTPPASSITSIEDIIKYVKPEDTSILVDIPAHFLTEEQLAGKRKGLVYAGNSLKEKASKRKNKRCFCVIIPRWVCVSFY